MNPLRAWIDSCFYSFRGTLSFFKSLWSSLCSSVITRIKWDVSSHDQRAVVTSPNVPHGGKFFNVRLRGQFLAEPRNANGHFVFEMSFSCNIGVVQIVPVVSAFCLTHYKPGEGGPHHIKSDYIVSLMEQFVSQFCQHRLPRARCLRAAEPSGVVYFTPDALLNFIITPADTHTHALSRLSQTHTVLWW